MYILYVCYILYIILNPHSTFWKEQGNASQGAGQLAAQRDPSMTRCRSSSHPERGKASSSACACLCTSEKVAAPCCLCWPWTPHPQEARVPSPQGWDRHAGPMPAGSPEAPVVPLHGVTSAGFAKNIRWLFLTHPPCQRWLEPGPSPSLCCLPSVCGSCEAKQQNHIPLLSSHPDHHKQQLFSFSFSKGTHKFIRFRVMR